MSDGRVLMERDEGTGIARLTLNNPGRKNAIGPAMVNELLHALEGGMADEVVRCVVLTGAGDAFCAGGDFAQLTGAEGAPAPAPKGDYADLLLAMANSSKPIVVSVTATLWRPGGTSISSSIRRVSAAQRCESTLIESTLTSTHRPATMNA